MKKLLSFILAAVMLSALLYVPAAAATTPAPVFSMDISEYTDTNQVVKNGETGNSEGISIKKWKNSTTNAETSGPVKMTQEKENGTISYLSFSKPETVVAADTTAARNAAFLGKVVVDAKIMSKLMNENYGSMAVEFWEKSYKNHAMTEGGTTSSIASAMFCYGRNGIGDADFMGAELQSAGNEKILPIGATAYKDANDADVSTLTITNNMADYDWTHYVITRSWKETNSETHLGKFNIIKVYRDGQEIYSESLDKEIYNRDVTNATAIGWFNLAIGGTWNGQDNSTSSPYYTCFDGGISEFRIYNQHITADQAKALYNVNRALYTAEDKKTSISLETTAGGSIKPLAGEISLTFDAAVDAASLSAITMVDENNRSIPGGVVASVDEGNSKIVNVKHGVLEADKTYKLVIGADLASAAGYRLGTAKELTYKTDKTTIISDYNFNDALNEDTAISLTGLSAPANNLTTFSKVDDNTSYAGLALANNYNDNLKWSKGQDTVEGKTHGYLKASLGTTLESDDTTTVVAPEVIVPFRGEYVVKSATDQYMPDNFAVELEFKQEGATQYVNIKSPVLHFASGQAVKLFNVYDTTKAGQHFYATAGPIAGTADTNATYDYKYPYVSSNTGSINGTATNEFGYIHTKQTFTKDTNDLTGSASKAQDQTNGNTYYIHTTNLNDTANKTAYSKTANYWATVGMRLQFKIQGAAQQDTYMKIGSVKVYEVSDFEILNIDTATYRQDGKVVITMNDDIQSAAAADFAVTKADGTEITGVTVDTSALSDRRVTLTIPAAARKEALSVLVSLLSKNSVYANDTFTLDGAAVITADTVTFKDAEGTEITALSTSDSSVTASVTLTNNTSVSATPCVLLALYDGSGRMAACAVKNDLTIAAGGAQNYDVTLTVPNGVTLTEDYFVKCIALESMETVVPIFAGSGYCLQCQ